MDLESMVSFGVDLVCTCVIKIILFCSAQWKKQLSLICFKPAHHELYIGIIKGPKVRLTCEPLLLYNALGMQMLCSKIQLLCYSLLFTFHTKNYALETSYYMLQYCNYAQNKMCFAQNNYTTYKSNTSDKPNIYNLQITNHEKVYNLKTQSLMSQAFQHTLYCSISKESP